MSYKFVVIDYDGDAMVFETEDEMKEWLKERLDWSDCDTDDFTIYTLDKELKA